MRIASLCNQNQRTKTQSNKKNRFTFGHIQVGVFFPPLHLTIAFYIMPCFVQIDSTACFILDFSCSLCRLLVSLHLFIVHVRYAVCDSFGHKIRNEDAGIDRFNKSKVMPSQRVHIECVSWDARNWLLTKTITRHPSFGSSFV